MKLIKYVSKVATARWLSSSKKMKKRNSFVKVRNSSALNKGNFAISVLIAELKSSFSRKRQIKIIKQRKMQNFGSSCIILPPLY